MTMRYVCCRRSQRRYRKWQHADAINASVVAMDSSTRRTRGVQRGARSQQVVEKVRAATMAELARVGFPGLTIEGVAKAADVNRTTIYRRWAPQSGPPFRAPETGAQRVQPRTAHRAPGGRLRALMLMGADT